MPKRITIYEKATGKAVSRWTLDARECIASGDYVGSFEETDQAGPGEPAKPEGDGEPKPSDAGDGSSGDGSSGDGSNEDTDVEEGDAKKAGPWQHLIAVTRPANPAKVSKLFKRMKALYLGNDAPVAVEEALEGVEFEVGDDLKAALPEIVAELRASGT